MGVGAGGAGRQRRGGDDRFGADRYTPTPAVSHAILTFNRGRDSDLADGIVVTPSHNPPRDGGFKYNPPNGGPADTDATGVIAKRANEILRGGLAVGEAGAAGAGAADRAAARLPRRLHRRPAERRRLHAIRAEGIRIGADPLGGASVDYWGAIAERHNLNLTVVNPLVDATWRFMTLDTDGKIRMDCSSPNAMASLIANRESYQIATGNDADSDRHGIVTPDGGLTQPEPLPGGGDRLPLHPPAGLAGLHGGGQDGGQQLDHRPRGRRTGPQADRGAGRLQVVRRRIDQRRQSASAARRARGRRSSVADGSVWTTDKDGIILALLASEILAVTGIDAVAAVRRNRREVRCANVCAHRRARQPGAEGAAGQAVGRAGDGHRTGG